MLNSLFFNGNFFLFFGYFFFLVLRHESWLCDSFGWLLVNIIVERKKKNIGQVLQYIRL